jgi:hypothetical protein
MSVKGNGYRIAIAIFDFILFAIAIWGTISYSIALNYILTTGNYPEAKIAVIIGIAFNAFLAFLLFICFWGVLGRNKAYVKMNQIVFIVYSILVIIIAALVLIARDWVTGGIEAAFALFAILCAILCSRYYKLLNHKETSNPKEYV